MKLKTIKNVMCFFGLIVELSAVASSLPRDNLTPLKQISPDHKAYVFLPTFRPIISVSGGAEFLPTDNSIGFPVNFSRYNFQSNSGGHSTALLGIFGGAEFIPVVNAALQLGFGYYHSGAFHFTGLLSQGVDPQSYDYFNYGYKVSTQQLLIESKLLGTWHAKFLPYLSAGIGAAFNNAYAYTSSTNAPPFMSFTPGFTDNQTTSFVYLLGAGFDSVLTDHFRLGLGYRYSNFGKVSLGPATINTTTVQSTLSQSNLHAQTIIVQLTYIV